MNKKPYKKSKGFQKCLTVLKGTNKSLKILEMSINDPINQQMQLLNKLHLNKLKYAKKTTT